MHSKNACHRQRYLLKPARQQVILARHSRAGGNPVLNASRCGLFYWIPACAGMTVVRLQRFLMLSWQSAIQAKTQSKADQAGYCLNFPWTAVGLRRGDEHQLHLGANGVKRKDSAQAR